MMPDVVVIGGGLSGLSASVKLANAGASVFLFEQNPNLGGRTYSFIDRTTGDVVDNGQHLLISAYKNTIEYLKLIGTYSYLNRQKNLKLNFYHPENGFSTFKIPSLPKPFHLLFAILKYSGLSFSDRTKLIKAGIALQRLNKDSEKDLSTKSVEEWLQSLEQPESLRHLFWYPLVYSIMNELPTNASALVFARAVKKAFLFNENDSNLIIPNVGQTELYVKGAEKIIAGKNGRVFRNNHVKRILMTKNQVIGIETGQIVKSKYVISCVPHFRLSEILPEEIKNKYTRSLEIFRSSPIISINLWFDKEVMETDLIGLVDRNLQWVFNRRRLLGEQSKSGSYITSVISAAGKYINMSKQELVNLAMNDLRDVFPKINNANLIHSVVIKERSATFSATNDVERVRPNCTTEVENFFLAGDWTNTGLPATIEGAVQSGFDAASNIIERERGSG